MKKYLNKKTKISLYKTIAGKDLFKRDIDERIAVLEMLLWKVHIEGIPYDVAKRLKENGFLIHHHEGGLVWSDNAHKIEEKFNEYFNY